MWTRLPIRDSKLALREAATLLQRDRASARAYLRMVQGLAGRPLPYRVIVEAMRQTEKTDPTSVARSAVRRFEEESQAG